MEGRRRRTLASVVALLLVVAAAAAAAADGALPDNAAREDPMTWVTALVETEAGPVRGPGRAAAPRRFDRHPELTRRLAEQRSSEMVGARTREFMSREAEAARERVAEWKVQHAKEAAELGEKQARMERFRAQVRAKAEAGSDPWWLKDLPWWMPSPPEWGPLPNTMYTAYFHKPKGKPLSTPNYGPLFRSADNLELPLGNNKSPLPSQTASGQPLVSGDLGNTAGFNPGTTPRPPGADPAAGQAVQAAVKGAGSFLEVGAGMPVAEHPQAGNPDFWKPHFLPRTGADILPDRVSTRVPPHIRYDTSIAPGARPYAAYWQRWYAAGRPGYRPYRFVGAPAYPPPLRLVRARLVAHLSDEAGHQSTPNMPPHYPSKFEMPTQWQVAQEQAVGMREDHDMPTPY